MSIANILPKLAFILFLAAVVAIFGRAQSGSDEQAAGDSRQVWFNRNYNLLLKQVSDTEWHEIEIKTGKIWTKLSFVTSTPDYVELWIIPRNAPKRLFKDHSEDLEKGKWVTTASGEWKNGPPTPRPDAPTDERADVDNDDKAKEWSSAKESYLKEIDRSIKEVLFQIDAMEANVRKNGDLPGLEKAKEIRAAFTERGELADSINRDEYAILRKNAIADLTAKKNVLIVRLLEIKQDTNAQKLDSEFTDLVDPLQADLLARWTVAVQSYRSDFDVAKALILSQLKRKEELARENANPSAVEEAINSIALFKEHGIVPIGVSTATYEARLKTARDKLEQVNKSLVRSLLLARKDEKARDMLARFSTTVIRDSKTNSKGSATPRR